ncbi:hypothetical protein [Nevskia ramosa]|uniref:hypothetical protein n=1 Tax=Nevskia ramosa TaxID=64002 RepID=UPI003D0DE3CF
MNASEIAILRQVVNGRAFFGAFDNASGNRERNAAEKLRDQRLVKLVTINDPTRVGTHRYVAIPPCAEWDAVKQEIRGATP